jgi:hypothetical protein
MMKEMTTGNILSASARGILIDYGSALHKATCNQMSSEYEFQSVLGPYHHRSQQTLKATMMDEIGEQIYRFPSNELARILSPKIPKPGVPTSGHFLRIQDYDCVSDSTEFDIALEVAITGLDPFPTTERRDEASYYKTLASFLTTFITKCHEALDRSDRLPERQNRWYNNLRFIVGRPAEEGTDGAAPLEPDIMGTLKEEKTEGEEEQRLYWNPPSHQPTREIVLPVEMKGDWKDMITQAATYARSMFSAHPNRIFALALAFNQKTKELMFLVFHHGGLAASEPYDISKPKGLEDVARLFLTIALWSTAEEAGFVPCCNDTTYLLPSDKEGADYMSLTVERILFQSLCVRGRMTHVLLLRLPTDTPPADSPPPPTESLKPDFQLSNMVRRSKRIALKNTTSLNSDLDVDTSGGSGSQEPTPTETTTSTSTIGTSEGLATRSRVQGQEHGECSSIGDLGVI